MINRLSFTIFLISLIVGAATPMSVQSNTSKNLPVEIDGSLFGSSVPGSMVIGRNYSVNVMISNNLNQSVIVVIRMDFPVESILVDPLVRTLVLEPRDQVLTHFTLIAYDTLAGRANITAVLFILDDKPIEVQRVAATVTSIHRSSLPQIALVLVGLISVSLVTLFLVRRKPIRGGHNYRVESE